MPKKNEDYRIFFRQGEAYETGRPFLPKKIKVLCIFAGKRKSREQGANFDFKQFVTIRYETRDARRTSCYTRNEQNIVSAIKNAKLNAENIARYFPADSG